MKRVSLTLVCLTALITVMAQSRFTSSLPCPKPGKATIYGVVEADGKPLEGVKVSDGEEIVTTSKNGVYRLNSKKRNGNVFIIIPKGYMVSFSRGGVAEFWAKLQGEAGAERHDFQLHSEPNSKHALIAITDCHIEKQPGISLLAKYGIPSIKEKVQTLREQGYAVYTLNLGDTSFDKNWYRRNFAIEDAREFFEREGYPTPMFTCMGNHDNDGKTPSGEECNFQAEQRYRASFGPTYYSFNLGDVHYIMLDNIHYLNQKGDKVPYGEGNFGQRNYHHMVEPEVIEWIEKDLKDVSHSTPLVIGCHSPWLKYKSNKLDFKTNFETEEDFQAIYSCIKDYSTVHIISGHAHRHATIRSEELNITDHTVGAVHCSSWKLEEDFGGQSFIADSSLNGFEVFEIDGSNMSWYYNPFYGGEQNQFRVWDMNEVKKYCLQSERYRKFTEHYPERENYCLAPENQIRIMVWAWSPGWKVSVTEDGKELPLRRDRRENPQYTFFQDLPLTVDLEKYPKATGRRRGPLQMFSTTASSPVSTLVVTVTDQFGRTWKQEVIRPKTFTLNQN